QSSGAKHILEVGTLGGNWTGKAIPDDGEPITLEVNEMHAKVAWKNLTNAGLEGKCKVILGPVYDLM
ncbi:hypothetical protein F5877DRAFT_98, partial [Lentinula edodes]